MLFMAKRMHINNKPYNIKAVSKLNTKLLRALLFKQNLIRLFYFCKL